MLHCDSLRLEPFLHELPNIDIFRGQNLRHVLDDGDLHPEPAERLPELASDWPPAKHDHALRFFFQFVENRFVSEIADLTDAFDLRNHGATAGGDDKISG